MSHYHIHLAVNKEDIRVLKEEFADYLDKCGGLSISVVSDEEVEISPELAGAIRSLFVQLIVTIGAGRFEGLN